MEIVTSCDGCGASMRPGEVICRTCGEVAVARSTASHRPPTPPPGAGAAVCAAVGCGAPLAADAVECPHCGTRRGPGAGALVLDFPWGPYVLAPGADLVLGRDPADSPVAAHLEPHANISRRHATLSHTPEGLRLRDEGSSNGTFVDDIRVTEQLLAPGARVRLAAHFSFAVRAG